MRPGKGVLASERLEWARNFERFVENDLDVFARALLDASFESNEAFVDHELWPFLGELGVSFRLRGDE